MNDFQTTYLLSAEADLSELLNNESKAIAALGRAHQRNPGSPYLSIALARLYERRNDLAKARAILESCCELTSGDKPLNGALARLLTKHFPDEGARSEYFWRRSFTEGDSNYYSQFWYARQVFVNGRTKEAKELFRALRSARTDPHSRTHIRGPLRNGDGTLRRFRGAVERLEATYAWLSVDGDDFWVFLHRMQLGADAWGKLKRGTTASFEIGFNFGGPAAINLNAC